MTRVFPTFLLLAAVLTFGSAISAPANAAYIAEVKDPAGDSTSSHPGRDLLGVGIGFNQKTGFMVGAVQFRGSPEDGGEAFLTLYAGMRTADGCNGFPVGGFGAYTDSFNAFWIRQSSPQSAKHGEADKSGFKASYQTFQARSRLLAGKKWNCLGATLSDPDNPEVIFDKVESVSFRGLPELSVKVPRVRRAVPVLSSRKIRIRVSNPGDAPLRGVRVKVGRDRGVAPRPMNRFIRVIPARKHRVVTISVRPRRTAYSTAELKVNVRSGKLRASREIRFRIKHPREKPSGGGGGGGSGGKVCTQYFPDLSGETGGSLGLVPC